MTTVPNAVVATPPAGQSGTDKVGTLWSGKRFFIALLLFFNLFINYMDRINLSVGAPTIARNFGWDAGKMGLLFSSYQWSYMCLLLLWGWLSDRFGTRLV